MSFGELSLLEFSLASLRIDRYGRRQLEDCPLARSVSERVLANCEFVARTFEAGVLTYFLSVDAACASNKLRPTLSVYN